MTEMYYEKDADLSLIQNKNIGIISCHEVDSFIINYNSKKYIKFYRMKKLTLTFITTVFCIPLIFITTTVLSGGHEATKLIKDFFISTFAL